MEEKRQEVKGVNGKKEAGCEKVNGRKEAESVRVNRRTGGGGGLEERGGEKNVCME